MDRNGSEDLPDTAMASGSDAGEPGEHLGPADLLPDERRLLTELERDVDQTSEAEGDLLGDADLAAEAAEDERPLPGQGGAQDDGLSPRFTAPEE